MIPRIALVTHDYAASGGASTMARFLHRALADSGRFHPEIISLALSSSDHASVRLRAPRTWQTGPALLKCSREDVPFTHAGAWFSELEFQRYRPRRSLTALLDTFDIVQVVAGTPPWMCVTKNVLRPKFLWTATTTRADRASRLEQAAPLRKLWLWAMTRISELYERRAFNLATEVFALSDYTLGSVREITGRQTGRLAICGVDTDFYRPANDVSKKSIVCVGRLDDPRKNIGLLIKAYARLRAGNPNSPELWLVGPRPSAGTLRLVGEHGLTDFVRVLGPRTPAELPGLYQSALCFALSSDEEGLGIVLLEAMACGVPIVSTACGGPQTAIENGRTGFLTPVRDAESLAGSLGRLLSDPALRQEMSTNARTACLDRFSLPPTSSVFIAAYEKALGSQPTAAGKNRCRSEAALPVTTPAL